MHKVEFTSEENAALVAAGRAVQAELEAQKHSLLISHNVGHDNALLLAVLRARYRQLLLTIRLAHGCPEDQFAMHGSPESGYWFQLITVPESGEPVYQRNNAALS